MRLELCPNLQPRLLAARLAEELTQTIDQICLNSSHHFLISLLIPDVGLYVAALMEVWTMQPKYATNERSQRDRRMPDRLIQHLAARRGDFWVTQEASGALICLISCASSSVDRGSTGEALAFVSLAPSLSLAALYVAQSGSFICHPVLKCLKYQGERGYDADTASAAVWGPPLPFQPCPANLCPAQCTMGEGWRVFASTRCMY